MLVSTFVTFLIEAALIIVLGRVLFSVALPGPAVLAARRARDRRGRVRGARARLTGAVRSAEGSSAVVNFVYLPMAIISGTFFSPAKYPGFLRAIADVLPLTYFTKLTRDVMVRHHHLWTRRGLARRRRALGRNRRCCCDSRLSLAAARALTYPVRRHDAVVPAMDDPALAFVVDRHDPPGSRFA